MKAVTYEEAMELISGSERNRERAREGKIMKKFLFLVLVAGAVYVAFHGESSPNAGKDGSEVMNRAKQKFSSGRH